MCLTEVGHLHRALIGLEIDLEPGPTSFNTTATVHHGRLIAISTIPACPGFRHITYRDQDGNGKDAVVPNSLLVYVYCRTRMALRPGMRNPERHFPETPLEENP